MKKFFGLITSRMIIIGLGCVLQVAWFAVLLFLLRRTGTYVALSMDAVALCFAIFVCNRKVNTNYNLCWVCLILAFPFIGIVVFTLNGQLFGPMKKNARRLSGIYNELDLSMPENDAQLALIDDRDPHVGAIFHYLSNRGRYPVYTDTKTEYYTCGEKMMEPMIRDMENARKFIYAEFFIIDKGEFLDRFLDVMERKAKEGVDVRLIYDDMGTIRKLPGKFFKKINERGINCVVFNRFMPKASALTTANNRDHRKILTIDGTIAYTGGLNIADEYINKKELFGYWKDTGVRIEGEAVITMTNLFLASWAYASQTETEFIPVIEHKDAPFDISDGFAAPYAGTPFIPEIVAENVYLGMINHATRYIYIFTPYLALDGEMISALTNAAKSGVDVKLIVPGIPDKKSIYLLTQSYFKQLMDGGVRIFLYKPGFIHAKSVICDDKVCTVGSVNLDYRSLYLHFENGILFYDSSVVAAARDDFLSTLEKCEEDTVDTLKKRTKGLTIIQALLRVVAPML